MSGRAAAPAVESHRMGGGVVPVLLLYGSLLTVAEVAASYLPGSDGKYPSTDGAVVGMTIHIVVLTALVAHAAHLYTHEARPLGSFLLALTAVPLIRIFSLTLPFLPPASSHDMVPWLFLVSVPLLLTFVSLAKVLRISPRAMGLRLPPLRGLPVQVGVGASGIFLGWVEYQILRPSIAWIPQLTPTFLVVGAVAVTLSSGLAEELIFRGMLLTKAQPILGPWGALLAVTALFAAMHVGFLSMVDIVYVFTVGLYFGVVALRTKCLYGAIACHALANIVLYLVAPFVLPLA